MSDETKIHIVKSHDISLDSDYVKWIHDVKQRYTRNKIAVAIRGSYSEAIRTGRRRIYFKTKGKK